MRVIVAGSRAVCVRAAVEDAMTRCPWWGRVSEVVHGGARGVDSLAGAVARTHGLSVRVFPADWRANGKAAGPIRNRQMAGYADALVAVWDGASRGTANMIDEMRRLGKPVYVVIVGEKDGGGQ